MIPQILSVIQEKLRCAPPARRAAAPPVELREVWQAHPRHDRRRGPSAKSSD
jgi:uncharacterized protein (DUF2267 family)